MHFEPSTEPKHIHKYLDLLVSIPGISYWRRRDRSFSDDLRDYPLISSYLEERYPIELGMIYLLTRKAQRGRWPKPEHIIREPKLYPLCAFSAAISMVYERSSEMVKRRISGMLRDGLQNELEPFAMEMGMAVHLMRQGFDVNFNDLELGGFDYLVRRDGLELEVECKNASADVGRQIHRRRLYQLSGYIYEPMQRALQRGDGHLIRIVIPNRLDGNARTLDQIAALVETSLTYQRDTQGTVCGVQYTAFDATQINSVPSELTQIALRSLVADKLNVHNQNILMIAKPNAGAVIAVVQSQRPDNVAKGLYRQISQGVKQFTKNRPAVLCIRLADLTAEQLLDLGSPREQRGAPSLLELIATKLFAERSHAHVLKLAYTTPTNVTRQGDGIVERRIISAQGPAYHFTNDDHPLAGDLRTQIFTR
ncbi:hypothetical protein J2848_001279 [Azospirillum lipoferum]|uniref:Uncharacterized protein n=1 Tax=Azospirillum lipoferum TaxID=193 RepID=A0A5A9GVC1_AZOLI|nr:MULTISPECIES: hypothetical protein [Azospirillum]KAA0598377.1 hypothetical protein FZ942_04650 [Azospirillum lipoferum]MCP1609632.1 hypothetical protein [Azospirillum lipoferum]MDW5535061.1 hypothetical protein [Azospirillum sp. NL1]